MKGSINICYCSTRTDQICGVRFINDYEFYIKGKTHRRNATVDYKLGYLQIYRNV